MSGKVVKRSGSSRMDAQELDKIRSEYVKELPCHHWPRPNGFCVGENQDSVIRLCLDDLRFIKRAMECQEHWILTQDVKSIPESQIFSRSQDDIVKFLEHSFSLRKFLDGVEVPDIHIDEDMPF